MGGQLPGGKEKDEEETEHALLLPGRAYLFFLRLVNVTFFGSKRAGS